MNLIWALNLVVLHVSSFSCRSVLTENPKILEEYLASAPDSIEKNFSFKLNVVPYENTDLNPRSDKWSNKQTMKSMKYDENDRPLTIILAAIPKDSKETKDNVAEKDLEISHKLIDSLDTADKEVQDAVFKKKLDVAVTKQDEELILNEEVEDTVNMVNISNRRESNDDLDVEEGKKIHSTQNVPSLVVRKLDKNARDIAQNGHPKFYIDLPNDNSFTGKLKPPKLWNENMFIEADLSDVELRDKFDTEDSGSDENSADTNGSDPDLSEEIERDLSTQDISLKDSLNSDKYESIFNKHDAKIFNYEHHDHKNKKEDNMYSNKGEWLKTNTKDKSLKTYNLSFVFNR